MNRWKFYISDHFRIFAFNLPVLQNKSRKSKNLDHQKLMKFPVSIPKFFLTQKKELDMIRRCNKDGGLVCYSSSHNLEILNLQNTKSAKQR